MFDKSMKDEIKPLTLGVLKAIVKEFGDLVPDDTPVLMEGKSNHYDPKIRITRGVERTRKGKEHFVHAGVFYLGEGDGTCTIKIDGVEYLYLKPKVSKLISFVTFEESKDEDESDE